MDVARQHNFGNGDNDYQHKWKFGSFQNKLQMCYILSCNCITNYLLHNCMKEANSCSLLTNFLSMPIYIYVLVKTHFIIITFNYLSIYLSTYLSIWSFVKLSIIYCSYLMILFSVLIHIRHYLFICIM